MSNLKTSREAKKGYQGTFWDFLNSCEDNTAIDDPTKVNVNRESPAIEQLWKPVITIWNEASKAMDHVLTVLKVDNNDRSPFARQFHTLDEFKSVYYDFVTPISQHSPSTANGVSETSTTIVAESLAGAADDVPEPSTATAEITIDRVEAIITAVQENADEIPDIKATDDIESIEGHECDTFNIDVEKASSCERLRAILGIFKSANELSVQVSDVLIRELHSGMESLCMKPRERGSITSTLKFNSLQGRWFCKAKAVNAEEITPLGLQPATDQEKYVFERDLLLKLPSIDRKSKAWYFYRVMGVFKKYCNKWFLHPDGKVTVKKKEAEYNVVFLVSMVQRDPVTHNYESVFPSQSTHSVKQIYRRVDAYKCQNMIQSKLNLRP